MGKEHAHQAAARHRPVFHPSSSGLLPLSKLRSQSAIRTAPGEVQTCEGPWVLIATILASSMAFIDSTVVNVALPALQTALHASVTDIQWVVESYALLLASLLLLGGSLGDLYGRRRIFLFGVLVFAIGSTWCGLGSSISSLIVARGLQGIGVPGSLAIISASYTEDQRGRPNPHFDRSVWTYDPASYQIKSARLLSVLGRAHSARFASGIHGSSLGRKASSVSREMKISSRDPG